MVTLTRNGSLLATLFIVSVLVVGPGVIPAADAARQGSMDLRRETIELERGRRDAGGPVDERESADGHEAKAGGGDGRRAVPGDMVAATPPFAAGDVVMIGARWTDDRIVEVRTEVGDSWSPWVRLHRDSQEHVPDPDSPERGGLDHTVSEPIWTGDVDRVQFRATRDGSLDVVFIDSPRARGLAWLRSKWGATAEATPNIRTRADWGADESLRDGRVTYSSSGDVRFSVVHHEGSNPYWTTEKIEGGCKEAADRVNAIYRYHTQVLGYWDIAYNFVVDPCGGIWEGRAGGIHKPVNGAHAGGFNDGSVGVLALGTFSGSTPDPVTASMIDSVQRLLGWKLQLDRVNPGGTTQEISGGGSSSRWPKGAEVTLPVLSAHQISNATLCPGWRLMQQLFDGDGSSAKPKHSYIAGVRAYMGCAGFSDVSSASGFCTAIGWAVDAGVVHGFADGTFRPDRSVSRQAMAAFMYRLAGSPGGSFPDPGFTDVPPTHPFFREIRWAHGAGIITGFSDGTFRPAGETTRQAAVAFLHRLAGAPTGPFPDPGFTDVSAAHPFRQEIAWAVEAGIASGFGDGTFRPHRDVTRQAAVAFLHRS